MSPCLKSICIVWHEKDGNDNGRNVWCNFQWLQILLLSLANNADLCDHKFTSGWYARMLKEGLRVGKAEETMLISASEMRPKNHNKIMFLDSTQMAN